jgi:hypothetical protein
MVPDIVKPWLMPDQLDAKLLDAGTCPGLALTVAWLIVTLAMSVGELAKGWYSAVNDAKAAGATLEPSETTVPLTMAAVGSVLL